MSQVKQLHDSIGWVYVLENKAMPGLVKVGFTRGCPLKRAKQLSSSSGVPLPFQLVEGFKVYLVREVEAESHKMLAMFRCDAGREFFRVTTRKAAEVVREAGIIVEARMEARKPGIFDDACEAHGGMKWPTCVNPGEAMPGVNVPRFFGGAA